MNALGRRAHVTVIDDDESVREALPDLLGEFGFLASAYASAEAFLASDQVEKTDCLVVDVAMPNISGPDLQQELKRRATRIPMVFITAYSDDALHRRLMEQGAVRCLLKPFSAEALFEAVAAAVSSTSGA